MTLTTKQEHEKDRVRSESSKWTRCWYCETRISEQEWFTDEEGFRFCDEDCAEAHKEEISQ